MLTPYTGFSFSGEGTRDYRAGARLHLTPSLELNLEGAHREAGDRDPEQRILFRGVLCW